ncbi:MAG: hypothetical protein ABI689_02930 [Thermoanaerobaculia bacterium]
MHILSPRTLLLLLVALAAPLPAQDLFTRITDLRPGSLDGVPALDAVVWSDALYFVGFVGSGDSSIYRYDGVNAPQIVAGSNVFPEEVVVYDGDLHFRGGPAGDRELWRYDGVATPLEVLDLLQPGEGSPKFLTPFGSLLCFRTATLSLGEEPACWDGLTTPTPFDIRAGEPGSSAQNFSVQGGVLYFDARDDVNGAEGRVYTGTGTPTLLADLLPGLPSSHPEDWATLGSDLYFSASDSGGQGRLFRKPDGLPPVADPLALDLEGGVTAYDGALFVAGHEDEDGGGSNYLWRYTGTTLTPLQPSVTFANRFLPFANALYFTAGVDTPSRDLYRWCGSESVELLSVDFFGPNDSIGAKLVPFGDKIYLAADNGLTTGSELWSFTPSTAIFCDGFGESATSRWNQTVP